MSKQEAITSLKILYCNRCQFTDDCEACFAGIAIKAIEKQISAEERILERLEAASYLAKSDAYCNSYNKVVNLEKAIHIVKEEMENE